MYQKSSEKDPSNTAYRQLAQQHQKEMDRHFQEWHGKAIGSEEPSTAPDTITDEQRFAILTPLFCPGPQIPTWKPCGVGSS